MSSNYIIGSNGQIPWFIKGELKRFKEITMNHNVIMGRKTYDSIGKILEKRKNIIISKNKNLKIKGACIVSSFDDAIKACEPDKDIFVIGGSKIYETAMNYCHYLLLTVIHKEFDGDTIFPKFDKQKWRLIDETRNYDIENKFSYSYLTFISQ